MKVFWCFTFCFTLLVSCESKNNSTAEISDREAIEYISKKGKFTPFTNKVEVQSLLGEFYTQIVDFMQKNDMNQTDYFIPEFSVAVAKDLKHILVEVKHIDGFKKEMTLLKVNPEAKIGGNLSGKDGSFIFNYGSNKITRFQLKQ